MFVCNTLNTIFVQEKSLFELQTYIYFFAVKFIV
jgi:hypothetical protein